MTRCALCHAQRACGRRLPLCGSCLDELTRAQPELKTYPWFVAAVRRALYKSDCETTRDVLK